MNNLDIYICAHKDFDFYPHNNTYKIITDKNALKNHYDIQVYEEQDEKYTPLQKCINEFTRMWYVYKNLPLKEYIGFCHYRRYFDFFENIPSTDELFNDCDIIVHAPIYANVLLQYGNAHNISDYYIIRQIIMNLYDDITIDAINSYEQQLFICNIFIMKSDMFKKYCEFMSSIIDEYIKFMRFKTYDDVCNHIHKNWHIYNHNGEFSYQTRIIAFLTERISNIFYQHYFSRIKTNNVFLVK